MATRTVIYRATVYAARSVDSSEATVLTPKAGADHSDNFKVASAEGVSGFKNYLHGVQGKRGRMDLQTKRLETGQITLTLVDKSLAAGTNAARWVTSFVGDAAGKDQLKGCKVKVERALDGATFAAWWTGRIRNVRMRTKNLVELDLNDLGDDLQRQAFVGAPHSSITYAYGTPLVPYATVKDFGNILGVGYMGGTVRSASGWSGNIYVAVDSSKLAWNYSHVTEQLISYSIFAADTGRYIEDIGTLGGIVFPSGAVRMWLKRLDTSAEGIFDITMLNVQKNRDGHYLPTFVWPGTVASGYQAPTMSLPPDGTAVSFYLYSPLPPSQNSPLFVNNVHPIQFIADVLDGKFGYLDASGNVKLTVARGKVAGWSTGDVWKPLIDDLSLPAMRFVIPGAAAMGAWIEEHILTPLHLGWMVNASGQVVLIDLRRPTSAAGLSTLTDDDLAGTADAEGYETRADNGVTRVNFNYLADYREDWKAIAASPDTFPSPWPGLIQLIDRTRVYLNSSTKALDIGEQPLEITADGYHVQQPGPYDLIPEPVALIRAMDAVATEIQGLFGEGAQVITLHCRPTATVLALTQGQLVLYTISAIPNQATTERGGTRLARITDISDPGPSLDVTLTDLGSSSTSSAPTVGALALDSVFPKHIVTVPITLDAASDPVVIRYAITATAVGSAPGDTSGYWRRLAPITASATVPITNLPGGMRIWVQARSQTLDNQTLKLPSAWAAPGSGTAYKDTTALTAPSSVDVPSGTLFSGTALVTWTNGEPTLEHEITISTGSSTTAADVIAVVAPGTTRYLLQGLDASSTHTVGVRARDPFGGYSALGTKTFTTGSSADQAPTPLGLAIAL